VQRTLSELDQYCIKLGKVVRKNPCMQALGETADAYYAFLLYASGGDLAAVAQEAKEPLQSIIWLQARFNWESRKPHFKVFCREVLLYGKAVCLAVLGRLSESLIDCTEESLCEFVQLLNTLVVEDGRFV
jgi:hypothetical protein